MWKWFMLGILCAIYRLFLEPEVLGAIQEVKDVVHLVRSRKARAPPPARTGPEIFVAGFTAAVIVIFWPLYILVAVGKLFGFTAGIRHERKEDG